jgi:hypothetical protein
MISIFIGYDPREAVAYHVCTNSIIRQSSQPVSITPLALNVLKGYKETQHVRQYRPFSFPEKNSEKSKSSLKLLQDTLCQRQTPKREPAQQ